MSIFLRVLPLRSSMSRILKAAPFALVWLLLAIGAGLHAATNPDPCDAGYICGDPPSLNGVYNGDGPSTLCPKDSGDWSITENKTDGNKTKKDCSSQDKKIGLKDIYWVWTLEGPGLLHGRLQGFGTSVNWTPDGNVFVGWPGEYTITWVGYAEQDDPDSPADCTGSIESAPVTTTFTILAPAATAKIEVLTDVCPGESGDLSFTITDTSGCSNDYRWEVEDLGAGELIFTLGPPKEGTETAGSAQVSVPVEIDSLSPPGSGLVGLRVYSVLTGEQVAQAVGMISCEGDGVVHLSDVETCPGATENIPFSIENPTHCDWVYDWEVTVGGNPVPVLKSTGPKSALIPAFSSHPGMLKVKIPSGAEGAGSVTITAKIRGSDTAYTKTGIIDIRKPKWSFKNPATIKLTDPVHDPKELCESGDVRLGITASVSPGVKQLKCGQRVLQSLPYTGAISTYEWTDGQGNNLGNGAAITAHFDKPGSYTVTVKVTATTGEPGAPPIEPKTKSFTVKVNEFKSLQKAKIVWDKTPTAKPQPALPGDHVIIDALARGVDGSKKCGKNVSAIPIGQPSISISLDAKSSKDLTIDGMTVIIGAEAKGSYTVTVTAKANLLNPGDLAINGPVKDLVAKVTIKVVRVNIIIDGVGEAEEIDPGAYVGLNNDDDNKDGKEDRQDPPLGTDPKPVQGENDLVAVALSVPLQEEDGIVTLSGQLTVGNGECARIYLDPSKKKRLPLIAEWPVAAMPKAVYIEGIGLTPERALNLTLSYRSALHPGSGDTANFTVYGVEITEGNGGKFPGLFAANGSPEGGTFKWKLKKYDGKGEWTRNDSAEAAKTGFRLNEPFEAVPPGAEDIVTVTYTMKNGKKAECSAKTTRRTMAVGGDISADLAGKDGILGTALKVNGGHIITAVGTWSDANNSMTIGRGVNEEPPVVALASLRFDLPTVMARAQASSTGMRASSLAPLAPVVPTAGVFDINLGLRSLPRNQADITAFDGGFSYNTAKGVFGSSGYSVNGYDFQNGIKLHGTTAFDAKGKPLYLDMLNIIGESSGSYRVDKHQLERFDIRAHDPRSDNDSRIFASGSGNGASFGAFFHDRRQDESIRVTANAGKDGRITDGQASLHLPANPNNFAEMPMGSKKDASGGIEAPDDSPAFLFATGIQEEPKEKFPAPRGTWTRDENGKINGSFACFGPGGRILDRKVCGLNIRNSIPQDPSFLYNWDEQIGAEVHFVGNHASYVGIELMDKRNLVNLHTNEGAFGTRIHGEGEPALGSEGQNDAPPKGADPSRSSDNFLEATYDMGKKPSIDSGMYLDSKNYNRVQVVDGIFKQARASFAPDDQNQFAGDIQTGAFTFICDDGKGNYLRVVHPGSKAGGEATEGRLVQVGYVRPDLEFAYDSTTGGGFVRCLDDKGIMNRIDLLNNRITNVQPEMDVGETRNFKTGASGDVVITRRGDTAEGKKDYHVSGDKRLIAEGAAVGVLGVAGYIAWQLEDPGYVEIKFSRKKVGGIDFVKTDLKVYPDLQLSGTANAAGTFQGYAWTVDLADASQAAPTELRIGAKKDGYIDAKMHAVTDLSGDSEMSYERANFKGTLKFTPAKPGAGGAKPDISGAVTMSDPQAPKNTATVTVAKNGEALAVEASGTSADGKFKVESMKLDSEGKVTCKVGYVADHVKATVEVKPDLSCEAELTVFAKTKVGLLTWKISGQSSGKATFTQELEVSPGNTIAVSGDTEGNLSGKVKGQSGGNTVDLGFSTNTNGDLIYNGNVAIKTGEVNATLDVQGENSDVTAKADVASSNGKNNVGFTIEKGGRVSQVRVGLGTDVLFFKGVYNPLDDSYDMSGGLPIVPGSEGTGNVTLGLSRDAGGTVTVGATGNGILDEKPLKLGFQWMSSAEMTANFAYGENVDASIDAKDGQFHKAHLGVRGGPEDDSFSAVLDAERNADGKVRSVFTAASAKKYSSEKAIVSSTVETLGAEIKKLQVLAAADISLPVAGGVGRVDISGNGGIDKTDPTVPLKVNPNTALTVNAVWYGNGTTFNAAAYLRQEGRTEGGPDYGLYFGARTVVAGDQCNVGLYYYSRRQGEEEQVERENVLGLVGTVQP